MDCGEKIAALRKSKGMTQADLGANLNITFQAVSKWERGESIPDFPTLCRIAKLFGVSVEYFSEEAPAGGAVPATETAAAEARPVMLGVCTTCGRVVNEGEAFSVSPALVCKACNERRLTEEKKAREARTLAEQSARRDEELRKLNEKKRAKHVRNKGLILSAVICGVILLIGTIGLIMDPTDVGATVLGMVVFTVFLYPFIAQLVWDGAVRSVCLAGGKVVGMPGVIFSLDLDGFIFLIVVKLLFAVIKFLIFLLSFLVCALAAIVISPFTFVPRLIAVNHGKLETD